MWNKLKRFQPKPWWFIVAPALAVLIIDVWMALPAFVFAGSLIWIAPHVAIVVVGEPLLKGLLYFPLGLWGVFMRNLGSYQSYWGIFCYVGWSVFLVLIAAGLQFPRRRLFIVLVILLLLNMIGFPLHLMIEDVKHSLMW